MDDKRLEQIKARAEAATPGPWGKKILDLRQFRDFDEDFTYHARQDILDLLAEVERLRAALAIYADPNNWYSSDGGYGDSVSVFSPATGSNEPFDFAENALKGGK